MEGVALMYEVRTWPCLHVHHKFTHVNMPCVQGLWREFTWPTQARAASGFRFPQSTIAFLTCVTFTALTPSLGNVKQTAAEACFMTLSYFTQYIATCSVICWSVDQSYVWVRLKLSLLGKCRVEKHITLLVMVILNISTAQLLAPVQGCDRYPQIFCSMT